MKKGMHGSGLCREHCPNAALELYRYLEKLLSLDIGLLQKEMLTIK